MSAAPATAVEITTDAVILGGGIAGLWLLNRLRNAGYDCYLLESKALGQGQSIASQGIIHGGLKYALDGNLSAAAQAIATMPARWRDCLAAKGDIDLSGCRILHDHYYMWSDGGLRSRLKTFLGSKSLRGRVDAIDASEAPTFFQQQKLAGSLYRLPDFVIDTRSLLQTLSTAQADRLLRIDAGSLQLSCTSSSPTAQLRVQSGESLLQFSAQQIVACAGEGNAGLMTNAGFKAAMAQCRPLHMVMVKSPALPELFVHCIGDSFSLTPRLTLTSHSCDDGDRVWYLGGELAETGLSRSGPVQIQAAQQLLEELFPGVVPGAGKWASFTINRAEGKTAGQHRPDSVVVRSENRFMVAWPTKFTLSPAMADEVLSMFATRKIVPGKHTSAIDVEVQRPSVAQAPWEAMFQ